MSRINIALDCWHLTIGDLRFKSASDGLPVIRNESEAERRYYTIAYLAKLSDLYEFDLEASIISVLTGKEPTPIIKLASLYAELNFYESNIKLGCNLSKKDLLQEIASTKSIVEA